MIYVETGDITALGGVVYMVQRNGASVEFGGTPYELTIV